MGWLVGIDAGWEVGWFVPDDDTGVPGYGPDGVATFAMDIEQGFKVTLTWRTPIIPNADGSEQRTSNLDRPNQHYDGTALLLGDAPRQIRARLARYAAAGSVFLLALPHEALPLLDDADSTTLTVSSTALARADWAEAGQRVTVLTADRTASMNAVIQSVGSGRIELDVAPGAVGNAGGLVMPAMAIHLEPQQDFARFKIVAERWSLSARAAIFDFALPRAGVDLGGIDPAWNGARLVSRLDGIEGNFVDFQLDASPSNTGTLFENDTTTIARMKGGTATLGDLAALVNAQSSNFKIVGTYDVNAVIGTGDAFLATAMGGEASGLFGRGATLSTYAGHPVWDKPLANSGTINDPVLAMTQIIDLGGVPYALSKVSQAAWGRAVAILGDLGAGEWQWLKLFIATVRGAQGMFWLPTWRPDLTPVSIAGTQLVARTDDESDITAWWPSQRDRIQISYTDGSVDYRRIVARVDNGDDTQTLTLDAAATGVDIAMVSWLEASRFESDTFEVTFEGGTFAMQTTARAHAVTDGDVSEALV
jgi:hypothetical protein